MEEEICEQGDKKIIKAIVFPVVLYGRKTWAKTRAMENKIDA